MVLENEQFKKHDMFCGPSLLVKASVSYDCFTDVYVILNGDLTDVHYRNEILKASVHPIDGAVGQAFVLTKTPVRKGACVVFEYIESERSRTYGRTALP